MLDNGRVGRAMPRRPRNSEVRTREHLTPEEVDKLMTAASRLGRHGARDATLVLVAYRHGLRVSELVALRWDQVDLRGGLLHVARLKGGVPSTHPLRGPELRALRRLRRDYPTSAAYVFTTERGGPLTDSGVRKIVARAGAAAALPFPIHPHMLRHACGFKLANDGQDTRSVAGYLGHRNITHTAGTPTWPRIGSRRSGGTEESARLTGVGSGPRGLPRRPLPFRPAPCFAATSELPGGWREETERVVEVDE
jgi:type 1 fimbriae regulatory protein FimE